MEEWGWVGDGLGMGWGAVKWMERKKEGEAKEGQRRSKGGWGGKE